MDLYTHRKNKFLHVSKSIAIAAALPVIAIASSHAAAPNVTDVVTDIDALVEPIALVGGAYISLKVFQRGWKIIRGFI